MVNVRSWSWLLLVALSLLGGCLNGHVEPPTSSELSPGGVYVAYNLGCTEGCEGLRRGDLIVAVNGRAVSTRAELLTSPLTSGRPVTLDVVPRGELNAHAVTIVAEPRNDLTPLTEAPPFWTVGAEALDRTPAWARAMMFGHAMPPIALLHVDGGWLSGRSIYGKKHLIVVWPDVPVFKEHYVINYRREMKVFYGVLQKARADLEAAEIELVFTVCGGSNDTTVRQELARLSELDDTGEPYPMLPVYRCPGGEGVAALTAGPARNVGLEHGASGFFTYTRGYPIVVLVDEGGIVRWHTNGFYEGAQNTILDAVMFALTALDERPRNEGLAHDERVEGERLAHQGRRP